MQTNDFPLTGYFHLFFDIFYKNNKIYLICPYYGKSDINNIQIICQDQMLFDPKVYERMTRAESVRVIVYKFESTFDEIDVGIFYDSFYKNYKLQHIRTTRTKQLIITKLFKHDAALFPMFYDYYKKEGVDHFYIYYNDKITDPIREQFDKKDVTLIEWNYQYHNTQPFPYVHHAQSVQINHALYRFGKDEAEYIICCDFDEYLYLKDMRLHDLIKSDMDVYGFRNIFAHKIEDDDKIPTRLPKKFLVSKEILPYNTRAKSIHKCETAKIIGIHQPYSLMITKPKIDINYVHFHFHTLLNMHNKKRLDEIDTIIEIDK